MMNMFRRLRRKKGFTLTELIVAVAIIGLLMACVAAFAQPVRSMMNGVRADSDSLKICEVMGNYLERRVAYADMVDAYVGYSLSDSEIDSAFDELIGDSTVKPDAHYTKGMLIMHFEADVDSPEYSTFKLYDVPIKDTDTSVPSDISGYNVFTDDFYNSYQFFMTTEEKMNGTYFGNVNNLTHNAFFSFRIMGYKFRNAGEGITSDLITDYYDYCYGGGDDPTDSLLGARTALENVSFTFENISIGKNSNKTYKDYIESSKINIHRNETNSATDMILFYTVKKYRSIDITT